MMQPTYDPGFNHALKWLSRLASKKPRTVSCLICGEHIGRRQIVIPENNKTLTRYDCEVCDLGASTTSRIPHFISREFFIGKDKNIDKWTMLWDFDQLEHISSLDEFETVIYKGDESFGDPEEDHSVGSYVDIFIEYERLEKLTLLM